MPVIWGEEINFKTTIPFELLKRRVEGSRVKQHRVQSMAEIGDRNPEDTCVLLLFFVFFSLRNEAMDEIEKIDRLMQEGNLQEAERLTGEALNVNSENAGLHFRMGQIHYRKQEWGKAINQFQQVLELDPSWPGAKEQIQMAQAILGYFTPDMFNP